MAEDFVINRRRCLAALLVAMFSLHVPGRTVAADDLSAMDGGTNFTCATNANGMPSCWGRLPDGQELMPPEALTDISAGLYHSCGVTLSGGITCWGDSIIEALDPPAGTFREVAVSEYQTCAVRTDDSLICWVKQPDGQPILDEPAGQFHDLSSATDAACALDGSDQIVCWGDPSFDTPPTGRFVALAIGADFGCALRGDGSVDCWGSQSDPAQTDFVAIAAGGAAFCGLRADGSLNCAANPYEWAPFSLPGPFDLLAVDWAHVCARRTDGGFECASDIDPDPGILPNLASGIPPNGTVGLPYAFALYTSSVRPLPTWSVTAGSLPAGLSLAADGMLAGTPTAAGSFAFTVRASNGIAPSLDEALAIEIAVDSIPPTGTISIASGAAYTRTTAVSLATAATDGGSGLSQLALSNDGVAWTTRPYAPSQSWTLASSDGTKAVHAKWRDQAGNWSGVKTDTIVLDTTVPTVTAPRRGFLAGTALGSGAIQLRVPWSGADTGTGIDRYELAQQTDGRAWTTVATVAAPTATRSVPTEHTYRFRVRAFDKAGNSSAWAYGETFRVSRFSEFNSRISYVGTWSTAKDARLWGGGAKWSTVAGSKASLSFTGRSIAWVAAMGPGRGIAEVYVNGSKVAVIDLAAGPAGYQRVAWVGSWTTAVSRKVTIKVLGTSGRPAVNLDALVTAD